MLIRGRMRRGLTSNGRGFSAFFYGVSPSNPLAIEAAARVRRSHAHLLPDSLSQSKPNSKLIDQVRNVMRFKHYSLRTERTYWDWIEHVKASLTCRQLL